MFRQNVLLRKTGRERKNVENHCGTIGEQLLASGRNLYSVTRYKLQHKAYTRQTL